MFKNDRENAYILVYKKMKEKFNFNEVPLLNPPECDKVFIISSKQNNLIIFYIIIKNFCKTTKNIKRRYTQQRRNDVSVKKPHLDIQDKRFNETMKKV